MSVPEIRTVDVVRYVKPLREGGSLPAIVEADDGFLYVIKFRGAGQGKKALIAELIGAELARAMDLNVPEIVLMNLDESFSRMEGDQEIQDLLKFSIGLNLGLHFLTGAFTYDPLISKADPMTSSKVVLLDSIITNIDRTVKNTNILNWNRELWLIDHGASLYFHHNWSQWENHLDRTFPMIKDHVLLERAEVLDDAAQLIKEKINAEVISKIVDTIPDDFLNEQSDDFSVSNKREIYKKLLLAKLSNIDKLLKEATHAR